MAKDVYLVGWPGAGKAELASELSALGYQVDAGHALAWYDTDKPVWALVDCRARVEDTQALKTLLNAGDVLVLMFWHHVSLDDQAWWLSQCRELAADKPYVLKASQPLSAERVANLLVASKTAQNPNWPQVAVWELDFPYRVVLQHAMFVLEGARQQMPGRLWRVRWTCQTQEYVNPVVIDMTPSRFEAEAATEQDTICRIRIVGEGVDQPQVQQQFHEWFRACIAPGQTD
jgi:hypothetical protein